jgi:hypothetical protein
LNFLPELRSQEVGMMRRPWFVGFLTCVLSGEP